MKRITQLVQISSWLILAVVMAWPMTAQAGVLDGITLATSYYNQPSSNTGGAALSARLPVGPLPCTTPGGFPSTGAGPRFT